MKDEGTESQIVGFFLLVLGISGAVSVVVQLVLSDLSGQTGSEIVHSMAFSIVWPALPPLSIIVGIIGVVLKKKYARMCMLLGGLGILGHLAAFVWAISVGQL